MAFHLAKMKKKKIKSWRPCMHTLQSCLEMWSTCSDMRRVTAGVRMQSPRRHREYHLIQTLQVITGTRRSSRYRMTQHLGTLCSLSRLNALGPALQEEVNSQRTGTWKNQIDSIHVAPVQQLCGFCCFFVVNRVFTSTCHVTGHASSRAGEETNKQKEQKTGSVSSVALDGKLELDGGPRDSLLLFVLSWPGLLVNTQLWGNTYINVWACEQTKHHPPCWWKKGKKRQKRQKL